MKSRSWISVAAELAVFFLLEAASLYMISNNGDLQKNAVARAIHNVSGTLWGGINSTASYFSLAKENQRLAEENSKLTALVLDREAALADIHTDTMAFPAKARGFEYINAQVVKSSHAKKHNYFIINRGYLDGVKEKSGVVTSDGVVGIVDAVSAHHAYAFSFFNTEVSISARIGHEGAMGPMIWDGIHSNRAILKEIPLQFKYHEGDTVYTSGNSLLFPPDLPLGVAGKARIVNGATNDIEITLFRDYSAVRYVTVVHNLSFDEIEEFGK